MKKLLALILSLAFVLTACSGKSDAPASSGSTSTDAADSAEASEESSAESQEPITVGFVQVGHESNWRLASTESAQSVFSKENGYDLKFVDCDQNEETQKSAVRAFVQQAVDYIIIDPYMSTGWDEILTECEEAGIPVIVIDRTIEDSERYTAWVGSDFHKEGKAAGEWLKAYLDAKNIPEANILVIEGTTGASAQIGRSEGFNEIADKYGWNILDAQSGRFTEIGGQEVMGSFCKSYEGQFNVVVCQNDDEALGAMTSLDHAGVSYGVDGDVILLSFDACTAGLEAVREGKLNADFECDPLAAPLVDEIIRQMENGVMPEKQLYLEERWFAYDDTVSTFDVDGQPQSVTVVTDELIAAQY